jgi:hypothetical protein
VQAHHPDKRLATAAKHTRVNINFMSKKPKGSFYFLKPRLAMEYLSLPRVFRLVSIAIGLPNLLHPLS